MKSTKQMFAVLPLLVDPENYRPGPINLGQEDHHRAYWIELFRNHIHNITNEARRQHADEADIDQRCNAIIAHFNEYLDTVERDPTCFGPLYIINLCWARQRAIAHGGIEDPYSDIKARENETALSVLSELLERLDAMSDIDRPLRIVEGIFAGNIFDLGATHTEKLFRNGQSVDFHKTRQRLRPRPWLIDCFDQWLDRWNAGPHRCAVLFVDNAGFDIVLGMIPFARELLRRGTGVVLTANTLPALNDVTHDELVVLIDRVAELDAIIADALADGRLELVPSGNDAPLIDLTRICPQLADAVERRGVDLVVLEGMGRAIETNLDAKFSCDVIKTAMIKDTNVAEGLGGEVYDLMFKFEPG